MKLSGPAAAGIVVVAVLVILLAGYFYMRHATGADVVDQLHADMKKIPGGRAPFSAAQMEQFKQRAASRAQSGGAR